MPCVLITPEEILNVQGRHTDILTEAGFDIVYPKNSEFTRGQCDEEEAVRELSVADALIAGGEFVTESILKRLPRLRVIARNGVGYDRVEVPAATAQNVLVTITPTAVHEAAAEHALALLFAVSKNIVRGDRATRAGQWPRWLIEPIRGKTIGILGLGRIGRSMAVRSKALGMTVIAHDSFPDQAFAAEHNIELVDFDTLAKRCDILSVHCPKGDTTTGIVNRNVFAKMKPTSILINTARGPIVNEQHLIEALRDRTIMGAGLDVFEVEPPAKDNPLFELDNVVLTPHKAGADALAMRDMAIESATCVAKLYRGEWPEGAVVNHELRDTWKW
ncbi:MAG: phosphoglycerate dehydrogenase [Planctomycetales bacterium]|nr:phosphoglycerate dehydrogenase [Planctomycetales bacterium]